MHALMRAVLRPGTHSHMTFTICTLIMSPPRELAFLVFAGSLPTSSSLALDVHCLPPVGGVATLLRLALPGRIRQ